MQQLILVISPDDRELVQHRYAANLMFLGVSLVDGGAEFRFGGERIGHLKAEIDHVAVHDAVRPCTPTAVIDAVFAAAKHGAALPGLAVADTIKRTDRQMRVADHFSRRPLAGAAPQAFRKDLLLDAYAKRGGLKVPITDDAQLVEAAGHPVQLTPGSALNIKITTNEDLKIAGQFLKLREAENKPRASRPFEDERFS